MSARGYVGTSMSALVEATGLPKSNEAAEAPQAMQTIIEVRDEGRVYMRHMIYSSFKSEGEDVAAAIADEFSYFGMAGFDGVFVSIQPSDKLTMARHMALLTDAMASVCEIRVAAMRERA